MPDANVKTVVKEITEMLIEAGIHLDAVNADGLKASQVCVQSECSRHNKVSILFTKQLSLPFRLCCRVHQKLRNTCHQSALPCGTSDRAASDPVPEANTAPAGSLCTAALYTEKLEARDVSITMQLWLVC